LREDFSSEGDVSERYEVHVGDRNVPEWADASDSAGDARNWPREKPIPREITVALVEQALIGQIRYRDFTPVWWRKSGEEKVWSHCLCSDCKTGLLWEER